MRCTTIVKPEVHCTMTLKLFFGSLTATDANSGQLYKFSSKKAAALLAYLMLKSDKLHSRAFLANLLWSDATDERGLMNLCQTLRYTGCAVI